MIYKISIGLNNQPCGICSSDATAIPLDPANTDYARFKREIEAGTAELQDENGQPMSATDAKAYVATLP